MGLVNFLHNLASKMSCGIALENHISQIVDTAKSLPSFSEEDSQSYGQFLSNVLQATKSNWRDVQVVYPILEEHTDKLDDRLAELLRSWATTTLEEASPDEARYLAIVIFIFSNLIQEFHSGNKASNMEIAITGYEIALTVYTPNTFPQDWAMTQNNLANTYTNRIREDKAENLERAIACYQQALKVYTFDSFPQDWAMTQNNLANAYTNRIREDKAENLERAIACCQNALKVRTFDAFPQDWADTQNNLANAYRERIKENKAENLERAIAYYQNALKVYTFDSFPQKWAIIQNNLAATYTNRIKENKAENLERAIAYYQNALKVYTFDAFPYEWAMIQNNLGEAYAERIREDKAENLERAIACYQDALKVRSFDAFPYEWAMTQNNLAIAYYYRIREDKAENLERAIYCYQNALEVYTFEVFPYEWARTQNNLAAAYNDRIRANKAENLEQAIICCQNALKVRTFEAFPQDWADSQNNLASVYTNRIKGDKAENLERAIYCYQNALEVYTFEAFPYEWARTQNNLAAAYNDRIRANKAENLEQAITCSQNALKVRTFKAFPQDWADTQNNLANTYANRIREDKAENLELAFVCFQNCLKVYTFDSFPQKWALIQKNLANAYINRIREDKAENLEQAIACCQDALKVYTFDSFPQDWADTQNNLAVAYNDRIRENKAENLEQAIFHYQNALKVYTFDSFPQNHAETLFNLGMAYQDSQRLTSAYNTFDSAIDTVESLREVIVSGEESKRKQAESFNRVYSRMVETCLELGHQTEAIEYVERSKTRNLVEQILSRDLKTIFPADIVIQLERYRDEIATGQYQIQHGKAENPKALAQHLQELRQQRNELENRYLTIGSGFQFDHFQNNLDDHTAIVEFYITGDKFLTFIFTHQTQQSIIWQSQPKDLDKLVKWVNSYFRGYYTKPKHWQYRLTTRLHLLAKILQIDEIIKKIPEKCDRLILIPHQVLHLFPLHALPINSQQGKTKSEILMHRFPAGVSYAPSCQLLELAQTKKRPDFSRLFAVQDPTDNLDYANLEVEAIKSFFNPDEVEVLASQDASEAAVKVNQNLTTAHCSHFSCHGYFNIESPLESALILAEAKTEQTVPDKTIEDGYLTLGEIFGFNLNQCRLVTLSACETGLIDFNNISDEYIGLPSGFLVAGSPAVVSSLWTVNELSTAFLMIKFYENLQRKQMPLAVALNQAQFWLRDVTKEELQQWTSHWDLSRNHREQLGDWFDTLSLEKPFQQPYHWAAFCAIGE
jgi:CHAT domain-containing protein